MQVYTFIIQGSYEQCNYSTKYAFVDQAVSRIAGIYEFDTTLHTSHYEVAVSMEEEQKIYDTLVMMMRIMVPSIVNPQLKKKNYMQCLKVKSFKTYVIKILGMQFTNKLHCFNKLPC